MKKMRGKTAKKEGSLRDVITTAFVGGLTQGFDVYVCLMYVYI
jgi:hypothetical protein